MWYRNSCGHTHLWGLHSGQEGSLPEEAVPDAVLRSLHIWACRGRGIGGVVRVGSGVVSKPGLLVLKHEPKVGEGDCEEKD